MEPTRSILVEDLVQIDVFITIIAAVIESKYSMESIYDERQSIIAVLD